MFVQECPSCLFAGPKQNLIFYTTLFQCRRFKMIIYLLIIVLNVPKLLKKRSRWSFKTSVLFSLYWWAWNFACCETRLCSVTFSSRKNGPILCAKDIFFLLCQKNYWVSTFNASVLPLALVEFFTGRSITYFYHQSAKLKPHRLRLCLPKGFCVYRQQFNYKLFITK